MNLSVLSSIVAAVVWIASPIVAPVEASPITRGEPAPLDELESLGDVIAAAENGEVHVIYVHGMRADKWGASRAFRHRLIKSYRVNGLITKETKSLQLKPWPIGAHIGTSLIWDREQDWDASQPFVDRYVMRTQRHNVTITIDEVNWWPLLFPLKCRFLVQPESMLAGVDKSHLKLCHNNVPPYHQWIAEDKYAQALARKPPLGGAAAANKYLKQQIMDWGLSDAVIATGPMRSYLNAAMDAAFAYASSDKATARYVVISESLGSFVVLDAYAQQKPAVRDVLDATYDLYFFANQFALLDLSRIQNIPVAPGLGDPGEAQTTQDPDGKRPSVPIDHSPLQRWACAKAPTGFLASTSAVRQIISFSDPSDVLTFRVPEFDSALVSNVYVRNAASIFGVFEDPGRAHTGQMRNSTLWRAMITEHAAPRPRVMATQSKHQCEPQSDRALSAM